MDGPKLKPAPLETVIPDDDDREPTKEEIMEDIRQGLRDIKTGEEGQDALESLEELRREIYGETHAR
ncbi:MAG: hypothetical protein F4X02_14405 [Chloroflexi bacterium]|nr:hypothetical protein [Chloroflexota bacterium]